MKNIKQIAGVDEVGRGCLAGPVVSAAVIFKKGAKLKGIKDSKKMSFLQRKKISKEIKKNSYFSFGIASVKEIEKLNILQASLLSMKRAILKLSKKPDLILVDGKPETMLFDVSKLPTGIILKSGLYLIIDLGQKYLLLVN
mgnify:CR=1 FL=1